MILNWMCEECGEFNPPKRMRCWHCEAERLSRDAVAPVFETLHKWQLLDRVDVLPPGSPGRADRDRRRWSVPLARFLLSLLAFVIIGWLAYLVMGKLTWVDLLLLVLVLLLHETGHYLMMRAYGYRDVQMFFIPLFGAAVSGRSVSVSAAKEALVLLAGPVPGLLLGYGCGLLYILTGVAGWQRAAWLLVFLNGMNLLPLYPLDGGRLALLLFGGRSARGDTRLQSFLTLLFVGAALWRGWFYMLGLGLGMLLRAPHLKKLNQLVYRLRAAGEVLSPRPQLRLSEKSVYALVSMVKRERSDLISPSQIAEAVVTICRGVNARPLNDTERVLLTLLYVGLLLSFGGAWYLYQLGGLTGSS